MTSAGSGNRRADETRTVANFLLVGGTCYLLSLAILAAAVEGLGLHYVAANALSLVILTLIGHFLHRRRTFRSRGRYLPELARFALAITAQTAGAVILIAALVEWAGFHYIVANVAVTALVTLVSFFVQRTLVFRHSDGDGVADGRGT